VVTGARHQSNNQRPGGVTGPDWGESGRGRKPGKRAFHLYGIRGWRNPNHCEDGWRERAVRGRSYLGGPRARRRRKRRSGGRKFPYSNYSWQQQGAISHVSYQVSGMKINQESIGKTRKAKNKVRYKTLFPVNHGKSRGNRNNSANLASGLHSRPQKEKKITRF